MPDNGTAIPQSPERAPGGAIVHLKPWSEIVDDVEAQNQERREAAAEAALAGKVAAGQARTNHTLNYIMGRAVTRPE